MSNDLLTPEFRREYIKATKLYRRVAEYDTDLANDIMVSTFLISYEFIKGVVKEIFESKSF